MKGIYTLYQIQCVKMGPRCQFTETVGRGEDAPRNKAEAETYFLARGWRRRGSLWYCPVCRLGLDGKRGLEAKRREQ